jgi:hypothetical protein
MSKQIPERKITSRKCTRFLDFHKSGHFEVGLFLNFAGLFVEVKQYFFINCFQYSGEAI